MLKNIEKISWYISRYFMFIHEVSREKNIFVASVKKLVL
jgi:hypothetical protein